MTAKQKQCLLAYLGYDTGGVDGIWGDKSRQATKAFQRDFGGISVDGIAGEETEKALKHAVAYGIDKKPDCTDCTEDYTDVQNNSTGNSTNGNTGTFWDEIKYFTREEFACKCGGRYCNGYPVEIDAGMVKIADQIRVRIGKPIPINSGLRCKTHNANVGGISNSQHLLGKAADLGCPSGCTPAQMASIADEIMGDTGGIGTYSWGIHIDTRSTKSRWNG